MPSAATKRRGAFLNWRFAVNGIQKASRVFGSVTVAGSPVGASFMAGELLNHPAEQTEQPRPVRESRQGVFAVRKNLQVLLCFCLSMSYSDLMLSPPPFLFIISEPV